MLNLLGPTKSLMVTSVFVALVLTAAFEFWSAVFKESIRVLSERPAIPKSVRAVLIQAIASAMTFGAFCLESGSYTKVSRQ